MANSDFVIVMSPDNETITFQSLEGGKKLKVSFGYREP